MIFWRPIALLLPSLEILSIRSTPPGSAVVVHPIPVAFPPSHSSNNHRHRHRRLATLQQQQLEAEEEVRSVCLRDVNPCDGVRILQSSAEEIEFEEIPCGSVWRKKGICEF